jgi:hypothetical protein
MAADLVAEAHGALKVEPRAQLPLAGCGQAQGLGGGFHLEPALSRRLAFRHHGEADAGTGNRGPDRDGGRVIPRGDAEATELAGEVGSSFICLGGEPSLLTLEYFSDDLRAAIGDRELSVFVMTDINPAGVSIRNSFLDGMTLECQRSRVCAEEAIRPKRLSLFVIVQGWQKGII